MAASTRHIIQRQIVWLDSPGEQPSFGVQERVSAYCRNQLPTLLESLFDRYADAETIIRIDQVSLDVGQLSVANLEEQLTQQLTKQVEQVLSQLNGSGPSGTFATDGQPLLGKFERFTRDERIADQLRYFLINGYLPNWAHSNDFEKLTHWLITPSAQDFRRELRMLFGEKPYVISRLIHHCPDLTLQWIATESGDANQIKAIQLVLTICQNSTGLPASVLREHFWMVVLGEAISGKTDLVSNQIAFIKSLSPKTSGPDLFSLLPNALKKLINTGLPSEVIAPLQNLILQLDSEQTDTTQKTADQAKNRTVQSTEISLPETTKQESTSGNVSEKRRTLDRIRTEVDTDGRDGSRKTRDNQTPNRTSEAQQFPSQEGLFVPFAGIVLLHLFLVEVFSEMGLLLHRRQWVDEQAMRKGVQMLAYLATGKDFCPEFDMPLLKLLCGLPVESVVSPDLALTDNDRQLAAELLEAVIQHWSVLGTVSPDGLREAFLHREGKLEVTDTGWRLTVERKTLDILLSRLPWGYSLIKLPFMPTMLYVDWT